MIELTDEQLNRADSILSMDRTGIRDCTIESAVLAVISFLTLQQIKQLAEQHDASMVQWVEFDAEDESTWPITCGTNASEVVINQLGANCIYLSEDNIWFSVTGESKEDEINSIFSIKEQITYTVTHWSYLPQPKEK